MLDGTIDGYESYEEAVAAQPAEPLDGDRVAGTDMLYSSGTTGPAEGRRRGRSRPSRWRPTPAGVGRPVLQLLFGFDDRHRCTCRPRRCTTPLRCASRMASQALGGTVVVMEHFDAEQYLALIERYQVTHTQVVPTMFVRMLKLPEEVRARTTCRRCSASSTPPRRARCR